MMLALAPRRTTPGDPFLPMQLVSLQLIFGKFVLNCVYSFHEFVYKTVLINVQ